MRSLSRKAFFPRLPWIEDEDPGPGGEGARPV